MNSPTGQPTALIAESTAARDKILKRIRAANSERASTVANTRAKPELSSSSRFDSPPGATAEFADASASESASESATVLPEAVRSHMQSRRAHTLPSWPVPTDDTDRLLEQMERVQITLTRVQTQSEVVQVVEEYRREHHIQGPLIVSPSLRDATGFSWPADTLSGAARDALVSIRKSDSQSESASKPEVTSVTPCFCAVAETGSIVTASDSEHPSTLNFLPDNHIVVLHEEQIVKHLDDVWKRLRETAEDMSDIATTVPRAVNFVTGPSRTADIEQTLELGAHGPRRMHVVLVAAALQQET